jgi:hypothetical protein
VAELLDKGAGRRRGAQGRGQQQLVPQVGRPGEHGIEGFFDPGYSCRKWGTWRRCRISATGGWAAHNAKLVAGRPLGFHEPQWSQSTLDIVAEAVAVGQRGRRPGRPKAGRPH